MANTLLFDKRVRQRGTHGGIVDSVTGSLVVPASGAVAGPNNILRLGEGQVPSAIVVRSRPGGVTGSYTFTLVQDGAAAFKRPDGTVYPALAAPFTLNSTAAALPATGEVRIDVPNQPAVKHGPTILVMTGASTNANAFETAVEVTVEFTPEIEKAGTLGSAQ